MVHFERLQHDVRPMNKKSRPWPKRWVGRDHVPLLLGIVALIGSIWLLSRQLTGLSLEGLASALQALPASVWAGCAGFALVAYMLLIAYDHLALVYLRRRVDPVYVSLCAATAYAVAHMVGASVISGALVRYRAYSLKGLSKGEIGTFTAFSAFTFVCGIVVVTCIAVIAAPFVSERLSMAVPFDVSESIAKLLLGAVVIYLACSFLPLPAIGFGRLKISYPAPHIAFLQIALATAEIMAAAMVIFLALPAAGNPGFLAVAGIFALALAAALISHSPGGLGVFELLFLAGLSDMNPTDVIAALVVFRLFYFVAPFIVALAVVARFELGRRPS
jgi:glycosyltransferase 2 family protein